MGWTEERLYIFTAGLDYIEITSTLEKLTSVLHQMHREDERAKRMALGREKQGRRLQEEWLREREDGPPFEEEEEEEGEYSLLFAPPEEHDWVKVSEPYVPKFPTEEEIWERKERRKEQLKQVMEPITQPVSEPRRGCNYFMDQPGTAVTCDAMLPERAALWNNWTLSDKSES